MPSPRFERGNPGGPGRPAGSWGGRRRALQVIDDLLAQETNLRTLGAALQARFEEDPAGFWLTFGAPLLPREAKLELAAAPGTAAQLYQAYLLQKAIEEPVSLEELESGRGQPDSQPNPS